MELTKFIPFGVKILPNGANRINSFINFTIINDFVNGKETIRVGRNVDLIELEKNIKRYYDMLF